LQQEPGGQQQFPPPQVHQVQIAHVPGRKAQVLQYFEIAAKMGAAFVRDVDA